MKLSTFVKSSLPVILIPIISLPIVLTCTSCSDTFDDKNVAPSDIYRNSATDNTFIKYQFQDPPYYKCSTPEGAFNLFETEARYSSNILKWDFIAALCLSNDPVNPDNNSSFVWTTAKINEFNRKGIMLMIKVTFYDASNEEYTVWTGQPNATEPEYESISNFIISDGSETNPYSTWQIPFSNVNPNYYDWCGGKSIFFGDK